MKKRIKTNCNYTLKPESHSFLGEKGKQIIFSGSGYAECEGTNGIIVNENEYYNTDSPEFANNPFGSGSAMNKRLRCNTFSFQIRNKNLYGAGLLNLQEGSNNDWETTTLTADPATGVVHWVGSAYSGNSGENDINIISFFGINDPMKTYRIGSQNVYFSCFAKGLKINSEFSVYLDVDYDDNYFVFSECENGGLILNEEIETYEGELHLQQLLFQVGTAPSDSYINNAQDVWFYPVISTEPITEEFFENYVGFVPFPDYVETFAYPESGDNKQIYALPYSFNTPFFINNYDCEICEEFVNELFKNYGYRADNNKAVPWGSLQPPSENLDFQWVWNTVNSYVMGNEWVDFIPIEESFNTIPQQFKPLFLLGYHNGALSLITTGEKIPPYVQYDEQYIRPVIQTLVFVNYETEVPDYISPVYTIVYPTLVNAE